MPKKNWFLKQWESLSPNWRAEIVSGFYTVASAVVAELAMSGVLNEDFNWDRSSFVLIAQVIFRSVMKSVFALLVGKVKKPTT